MNRYCGGVDVIAKHFPFESFRPNQKEVLDAVEESLDDYNYIMLEAPTGLGKSAIAYAIAKWGCEKNNDLSHIVVDDKYLSDQYLGDFPDLVTMKGRSNFNCPDSSNGLCDKGHCVMDRKFHCPFKPSINFKVKDHYGVIFDWDTTQEPYCEYWEAKYKAIRAPITVSNYSYFLTEHKYAKCFSPRWLSVLDEAHNVEGRLMDFISLKVTLGLLNRFSELLKLPRANSLPSLKDQKFNEAANWISWLEDVRTKFRNAIQGIEDDQEITEASEESPEITGEESEDSDADELEVEVIRFVNRLGEIIDLLSKEPDNWVVLRDPDNKSVTFKPVTVHSFAHQLLFDHTEKHLLMSATILDHKRLSRWLGIDEPVKFIQVPESTFPVENRPLIKAYVGRANRETLHKTYLPALITYLDSFMPEHLTEKGVLHTHTNAIANYIYTHSQYRGIMMSNVGSLSKRETVFRQFFDAKPPRVMVTPSMKQGVDLKDDRARWQMVCKVPYPDLGDPQISKRRNLDPDWYNWMTLMSLIQTYGRICRSEEDYGATYVLDSLFDFIISKNYSILPKWFKEAIR
jgi:Rad3-related DNA helicase